MNSAYSADDHRFMARALRLAERGLYTTDPNPRVGCVLVRDGQVVGEGWHRRAGELHAERIALAAAGEAARGATAYVTLEPCAHHGRTPPCAQGLIEVGPVLLELLVHPITARLGRYRGPQQDQDRNEEGNVGQSLHGPRVYLIGLPVGE